jgi:hypothetical protein
MLNVLLQEGTTMTTFHDPRGEVATAADPYTLSYNLAANDGDGTTVALLANGFPDSDNFLVAVGAALTKRLPKLSLKFWNKGNASIPAPDDMLAEIKASCQVAIAAYGH